MLKKTLLIFSMLSFIMPVLKAQVLIGQGNQVGQSIPVEPYYGYTYSQVIYKASEINSSGTITGIKFYATPSTTLSNSNEWAVYIGHTTKSNFSNSSDWEDIALLTESFNGVATVSGGIVEIVFTTPFIYNGTDNLVIAVDENTSGYDSSSDDFYCTSASTNLSLSYYNDSNNPDPLSPPTGTLKQYYPNVELLGITQSCPGVTNLSTSNLLSNTVNLQWNETGSATEWEIEYGTTGFALGSGTTSITTNNPLTISGLTATTAYEFYVRAICGVNDTSVWSQPISVTTPCATELPDYLEDFATYLSPCWSETKGALMSNSLLTGTISNWASDGFTNVGTTGSARMNIYGTNRHEWLISPSIDLGTGTNNYRLEFDAAFTDYANTSPATVGQDDSLVVVISTDNGTTWSNTNILQVFDQTSYPSNAGEHIIIDLTGYIGIVKFGFYATSNTSNEDFDAFIDNFEVVEFVPCTQITTNITEQACGSFDFNGTILTSTGSYADTIVNAAGCDSIVNLDLTINGSIVNLTEQVCDSFDFNGVTLTSSGVYNDTLTNISGCDSIVTLDLTINGSMINITEQACNSFDFNGVTLTNTGIYIDTLTNTDGCDSIITLDLTITIIDAMTTVIGNTITANTANVSYQWIDCGLANSSINGETQQSFTPLATGDYAVIISDGVCSDTSDCETIDLASISSVDNEEIMIYPNPSAGKLVIHIPNLSSNVKCTISNTLGQTIITTNIMNEVNSLNLNELPEGIYFVSIYMENELVQNKITLSK
ncbi:MAG: T9SS type A sorting domain-containing protein [Crocinitomicaceae bacterium]|nr:T9SS type A sorting domain-containing protein [Crocinitomicaceae bacterium]